MALTETINAVKDAIYKKLSYTNQDYDSILTDIINLFRGSGGVGGLTSSWDNISESDIMFIFMSLLAAHKDILNYMLDYRILESYMSTARERQSLVRIANSYGYKIPSYKAARAQVTLSGIGAGATVPIAQFTTFKDDSNISWTYIGETFNAKDTDVIDLYQGIANTTFLSPASFNNPTKTSIITNGAVAIGNNYNSLGCSLLVIDTDAYEEVDNIYNYRGDGLVYELNVDPQGLTYIKLPVTTDTSLFTGKTITFYYIVTNGESVGEFAGITSTISDKDVTFTFVDETFVRGSNPATPDFIRENFKNYYASASSLVTLNDYKNFITSQKVVPGITKCVVIDSQSDTILEEGDATIDPLYVGIYVLKEDNEALESTEEDDLLTELARYSMTGVSHTINAVMISASEANPLTDLEVTVKINGFGTSGVADGDLGLTVSEKTEIETAVEDYIVAKDIGEELTAKEIHDTLAAIGFDFYGLISVHAGGHDYVQPAYYEYLTYGSVTDV